MSIAPWAAWVVLMLMPAINLTCELGWLLDICLWAGVCLGLNLSNMSPDDTIALAPLLCVHDLKIILEMLCCLFASSLSVITSLCFADLGILARFSWFLLGAPESWILITVT